MKTDAAKDIEMNATHDYSAEPMDGEEQDEEDKTQAGGEGKGCIKFKFLQKIANTSQSSRSKIYSVKFCEQPGFTSYLAVVAEKLIAIFSVQSDGSAELIQEIQDLSTTESYYAATWTYFPGAVEATDVPILCVGGESCIIKGVNVITYGVDIVLYGHGNAIYDLRTHPTCANLIVSASKDASVRLWNTLTCVCVAVFCGMGGGHTTGVLSIDIKDLTDGDWVVSSGLDGFLKVWDLTDYRVQDAVERSFLEPCVRRGDSAPTWLFQPITINRPIFSTCKVHQSSFTDCVRWYGHLIISKGPNPRIQIIEPKIEYPRIASPLDLEIDGTYIELR